MTPESPNISNNNIHQNNCKQVLLITDMITGEISCSSCGVVFSEKIIEFGHENSSSSSEEYFDNSRIGQKMSLKMADMGLSTIIEAQDKDFTGKSLSNENKRSFYRLRMWDRNSRSSITKNSFHKAFTLLDSLRSKLGLPESVVEKSAYLFRKAQQKKLLTGRSTLVVLCAVVYITCRITDTPRTLNDIANAANVKKKMLQRVYRLLVKELDIKSNSYNPVEFLNRLSNEVMASAKAMQDARVILELGQKSKITEGKHPMAVAAAAMYLAIQNNHEKISQTKLSRASGISEVTIRNRVKELRSLKKEKTNTNDQSEKM